MAESFELRKFVAPEFAFGVGARHLAGRYAKNLGGRKILVVSDPGVGRGDVKFLTDHALKDPCMATNPRKASQREIEVVYEESL
jgi:alcohol dehydrogenase class IV